MAALLALGIVAFAAQGCLRSKPETATGVVIAVDGSSVADVDRFTLRTDDGRELVLRVGRLDLGNGGLPAPHLRDHLVSGEPVTVYYYVDEAIRYTDAAR